MASTIYDPVTFRQTVTAKRIDVVAAADEAQLTVKMVQSQSSDPFLIKTSSNTNVFLIGSDGGIVTNGGISSNGIQSTYFNSVSSNWNVDAEGKMFCYAPVEFQADILCSPGLAITIGDGSNFDFGTTTGTKFGTGTNQLLGFFNATPVSQQTVTGSKASGAALLSFLTAMANLGFIVNSTTA